MGYPVWWATVSREVRVPSRRPLRNERSEVVGRRGREPVLGGGSPALCKLPGPLPSPLSRRLCIPCRLTTGTLREPPLGMLNSNPSNGAVYRRTLATASIRSSERQPISDHDGPMPQAARGLSSRPEPPNYTASIPIDQICAGCKLVPLGSSGTQNIRCSIESGAEWISATPATPATSSHFSLYIGAGISCGAVLTFSAPVALSVPDAVRRRSSIMLKAALCRRTISTAGRSMSTSCRMAGRSASRLWGPLTRSVMPAFSASEILPHAYTSGARRSRAVPCLVTFCATPQAAPPACGVHLADQDLLQNASLLALTLTH